MATAARLIPTIVQYSVPDDISEERYAELVRNVGDWFAQKRNTKEPVALAKRTIDACMRGARPRDGKPWQAAATSTLATRIRIACAFDMETMKPLVTADDKTRERKQKERDKAVRKKERQKFDTNYPEEYRKVHAAEATYGDDPLVFFTSRELEDRAEMREAYVTQFPQLNNAAALPKLEQMLDLVLLQKRLRFRVAQQEKGSRVTEREMSEMVRQVVELEKSLGIDPVTLAKTQRDKEGGTVGDLVRRFESLGDWTQVRERWFAEELLLLFKMYHTPSPRTNTGGFQLDEVGLYGLTKTRLVTCPHCGNKNWAGLKIEEIEQWLVDKGHLVPLGRAEPIPLPATVEPDVEPADEIVDA